jgi:hypothetical protein
LFFRWMLSRQVICILFQTEFLTILYCVRCIVHHIVFFILSKIIIIIMALRTLTGSKMNQHTPSKYVLPDKCLLRIIEVFEIEIAIFKCIIFSAMPEPKLNLRFLNKAKDNADSLQHGNRYFYLLLFITFICRICWGSC